MRVINLFSLLLFIITICSCGSNRPLSNIKKDEFLVLEKTISENNLKDYKIYDDIGNSSLFNFLDENSEFEDGNYEEFGALRQWVSDSILNKLWTEKRIKYIMSRLKTDNTEKWSETDFNNHISQLIHEDTPLSKETKTVRISYPIIFDNNYAIIRFSSKAGFFDEHGSQRTLLFNKQNGTWKVLTSIPF